MTLVCGHDQLHAAGLARTVFFGTMLSKVAPLVVTTDELALVEETHVDGSGRSTDMLWIGCLRSETTSDDISSEVVILDGDDTLGSRKS